VKVTKPAQAIKQNSSIQNMKMLKQSSLFNPLYIAWAKVLKAYSDDASVDVELSSGMFLVHIPVRSLEWAGTDGSNSFGERDLPPEDCRVVIIFPDGIIENAFVLCSVLEVIGDVGKQNKAEFLVSDKSIANLPTLRIELYLNEQNNPHLNGKVNSEGVACDGLVLTCEPNEELTHEISEVLAQEESNFPYEYYVVNFATFSGQAYSGYRKFLKFLALDSSQINNDYATKEYIKAVYDNFVEQTARIKLKNEYRQQKVAFKETNLKSINDKLDEYQFSIRSSTKSNLETDLNIVEDDVPIENKGKGRQCFIKTEFALREHDADKPLDVLLLEEPENHLSHTNMKRLVHRISESRAKQIFVATHNSLISTRLNLRNSILLNSSSPEPLTMRDLPEDTAKFFMKAPDNNVLEFILSAKVILVEGDAEYILLDSFYSLVTGSSLEADDIHVISVGGTSFKRYLDIAKVLG
ncbi:hypothetical protein LCGC14_2594530, partial [marine sediment metagenome]